MRAREFVRDVLRPAGALLVRKDGDHHVYRLPTGRTLVVPMGGSQSELAPSVVARFRSLMRPCCPRCRHAGFELMSEPAPDGRPRLRCTSCECTWTRGLDGREDLDAARDPETRLPLTDEQKALARSRARR